MTRFAAVVPLYNKRPHIERAMRSVLDQTHPVDEIIVVDDGSTDGSYEYVQALSDPRIRLIRRDRPGPGGYAARNLGIREAGADWIAFLDADDEWLPQHLETVRDTIARSERPDALVCVGMGYRNVYPGGRSEPDIYSRAHKEGVFLDFERMLATWLAVGGSPVWTSATACRRDALIAAGLFPEDRCTRGGDKDLWLRIAAHGVTAINPVTTATYYKDAVNMVTKRSSVNTRHCMCHTIEAMLRQASPTVGKLLRKVYNLEVYKYCLQTAKKARLPQSIWRGFYFAESPARYLILATLSNRVTDAILRAMLRLQSGSPAQRS